MDIVEDQLFIGGRLVRSVAGEKIQALDPSTGTPIAAAPDACQEDLDRAVDAARGALRAPGWARLSASERGRLLARLAELMRSNLSRLAAVESQNNGKPIRETTKEVGAAARCFDFWAGAADKVRGATIPVGPDHLNFTMREPVGVVGAILPWNSPLLMLAWKIAPALACGNTVVVKPSEETPLTALLFARLCELAELPAGVVNVVTGVGERIGAALVDHPGIDAIGFTGHHETGAVVAARAARTLKRVFLELGGKSPNIVFDDADLESAVNAAVLAAFGGQGQSCAAGSRILVQRRMYDAFADRFVEKARRIRVGPPASAETQMGPVVSRRQLEKVQRLVRSGTTEGARLVLGGDRPSVDGHDGGFWLAPTVLTGVTPRMTVAQEEIFGPVATILPFDSEEEAVRIANGVIYGLTGAVWTRDAYRAHRVARQLEFGTVWINCYKALDPGSPYGGFRRSGYGKDNGLEAIENYTRIKSTWIHLVETIPDAYA
jgi:aldehyde dehydrogenase (NAD+)